MTKKIVIYDPVGFSAEQIQQIQESAAPKARVVVPEQSALAAELVDAEIFLGFHTPEVFEQATDLRWIQSTAAGLDVLLNSNLAQRDVLITNASGVHGPQVAELAWALTLAVARRIPQFVNQQQEHEWKQTAPCDLHGSTALVIGLGGIGRRYARVAAAFGMRVLAVDLHNPPQPDYVEMLTGVDHLDDLLGEADVVMLACPYTSETHHLLNEPRLKKMKSTAVLVNIARGGIVDEQALAAALHAGELAGAGLDVCETEPLPANDPLWDAPNLLITPHVAGLSPRRMGRLADFFCENLQRYLAGESLANLVDRTRGYPVP